MLLLRTTDLNVIAPQTASRSQKMKRGPEEIWPRFLQARRSVKARMYVKTLTADATMCTGADGACWCWRNIASGETCKKTTLHFGFLFWVLTFRYSPLLTQEANQGQLWEEAQAELKEPLLCPRRRTCETHVNSISRISKMISNFMPPGLLSMAAALCLTGGGLKAKGRAKLLKRRKYV